MIELMQPEIVHAAAPLVVPNPAPAVPAGLKEPADLAISWAKGIVVILGMIGLAYCAGQMVIGRRNRHQMSADGAMGIPWVLGGISLLAVGAPLIQTFL